MNIKDYFQVFKRQDIENGMYNNTTPLILLPIEMYDATKEMCNAERECRGIMLVPRNTEILNVKHMINIGYGSPVSVFPDERLDVVNRLLQKNPQIQFVEYHTHTIATGSSFYDRFSTGDVSSIIKNINKSNNYMHVLFTPTNICTFGLSKPNFAITNESNTEISEEIISWDKKYREELNGADLNNALIKFLSRTK